MTPLSHSSPLLLQMRRVPRSPGSRWGGGTMREVALGLSSEEGPDSVKNEERAVAGGGVG